MAAATYLLASFECEARGIKFYDVPTSAVSIGQSFQCELEPLNSYDSNCIALSMVSSNSKLGHLAREAAVYLAPLMREGFEAFGLVNMYIHEIIKLAICNYLQDNIVYSICAEWYWTPFWMVWRKGVLSEGVYQGITPVQRETQTYS